MQAVQFLHNYVCFNGKVMLIVFFWGGGHSLGTCVFVSLLCVCET